MNVRQGPFQQNKNPKAGRLQLEAAKSEIEEFFRNRDLSVGVKKELWNNFGVGKELSRKFFVLSKILLLALANY